MRMSVMTLVVTVFGAASAAYAAPETFFGEDLNPGTQGEQNPPLTTHPNSDAARDRFYARLLNGVETETFEALADGTVPPFQLTFGPDHATINGLVEIWQFPHSGYSGHYPTSGSSFLNVDSQSGSTFHIDFDAPQAAFGFYASDVGDGGARLSIVLHHPGGPDTSFVTPNTVNGESGSLLYFGVLDPDDPFDGVTIERSPVSESDGFGFDDMVIARAASVVPVVDSFFLPKAVLYKPNAKTPAKSAFKASGFFDTGSQDADLTGPATLTVGGTDFPVPGLAAAKDGRTFAYGPTNGLSFKVVKNAFGSSRATFVLRYTGDLGATVPVEGSLELRFKNALVDGRCVVLLAKGGYKLGKKRGALSAPNLFVVSTKATVPGGGKDTLTLVVGLASGGVTPAAAPDLDVEFGAKLAAPIPSGQFVRKGDQFVFKGNVNGVTSVVLDYAREQITVKGSKLDLGAFVQGQSAVHVVVALGAENRGVTFRVARKGNVVKY